MYKIDPPGPGDHLAMHLAIDGWALFREGDEAKLQAAAEEKKKAAADEARKEAQKQVIKICRGNICMNAGENQCTVSV